MLRITEQRAPWRLVLKVEGRIAGEWVAEVEACWRAATAASAHESIWIDLTAVCLVDSAGEALLARMHRAGVLFLTRGSLMGELVRELSES